MGGHGPHEEELSFRRNVGRAETHPKVRRVFTIVTASHGPYGLSILQVVGRTVSLVSSLAMVRQHRLAQRPFGLLFSTVFGSLKP